LRPQDADGRKLGGFHGSLIFELYYYLSETESTFSVWRSLAVILGVPYARTPQT
jgi:hypothetical protein